MLINKTQLGIIQLYSRGIKDPLDIAIALHKSKSQIYRSINTLNEYNILDLQKRKLHIKINTHAVMLTQLISNYPNLIRLLSGSSIQILTELLSPNSIKEIAIKTHLNISGVYMWIKKFQKSSIVKKNEKKYSLNSKLWKKLEDFLIEFKKFNDNIDLRIPQHAEIYCKNANLVIFSSKTIENATQTAFSKYGEYGIDILTTKKYYRLPIRKLTIREVFIDSLRVVEKETDFRNIMFITLFYLKHKNRLSRIDNPIFNKIKKILKGKNINGFPTLSDIKDRAKLYGVKI